MFLVHGGELVRESSPPTCPDHSGLGIIIVMCPNIITLPETNIAIENPPFWWYLQWKMGFSGAMLLSGRV